MPICFLQKANWHGGGEAAARKFLKNQASPVFQKLRRLAFKRV
jgi:ribosomal protein L4